MKTTIVIATGTEKVLTTIKELQFPEVAKYYKNENDGRLTPDLVLFAILPKYPKPNNHAFRLIEVSRNQQLCTDFIPKEDCKTVFWLKESGLRMTAFEIMQNSAYDFLEIGEAEFERRRLELLNSYRQ